MQAEDWALDIYGIGDLDAALQQQIEQDSRITYCGSTTTPQKVILQHSIFLLTSSFEGMPLVVLEAAACGVPTIAFDFGETGSGRSFTIIPPPAIAGRRRRAYVSCTGCSYGRCISAPAAGK